MEIGTVHFHVKLANFMVKHVYLSFCGIDRFHHLWMERRNLALVSDFVSWDSARLVPRHEIPHSHKIPSLFIHS